MISFDELEALSNIDIKMYNKDDVKDVRDFKIKSCEKSNEKIVSFLNDFNNPYCFTCNNVIVKVEYADTTTTLEDLLCTFLIRKKQE